MGTASWRVEYQRLSRRVRIHQLNVGYMQANSTNLRHSMSSISSYTSLSSSFIPSPGPLQAMQFAAQTQAKMEPPIDPLLINRVHTAGNAKTDAIHAAMAILDKAGISPLTMLLMVLDPAHAEFEKERGEFFAQENHTNIHALLTNLQSNTRLRQNFNVAARVVPTEAGQVPAYRQVSDDGAGPFA